MRTRRRFFPQWFFILMGLIFLAILAGVIFSVPAVQIWLPTEWRGWTNIILDHAKRLLPDLLWLGGIIGTTLGAALTLLASWHFAEMNLPQRIEDLKKAYARDHLQLQPQFLAIARRGIGPIPADIETSRLTLVRKWFSGWSKKEQARILAASANFIAKEARALSVAAKEAQLQQITAHLVRGYSHASSQNDDLAFEEFEAATAVHSDNILSRDIAAGWARRTKRQSRELELLDEMQKAAQRTGSEVAQAVALRRQAEILDKHQNEASWREARDRLDIARDLLDPLLASKEAKLEMGRVETLFCEIQCSRKRIGHLDGANGPRNRMLALMTGVEMDRRPEERDGEAYGEERARRVDRRVAELRGDEDVESED